MRVLVFLILLLTFGCSSQPISFELVARPRVADKYCLLVVGHNSTLTLGPNEGISNDALDAASTPTFDSYLNRDIVETLTLASAKGYICITVTSEKEFTDAVDSIIKVSKDSTQLLVAMSGECDEKGFNFNLVHLNGDLRCLVPPGKKLIAGQAIAHLSMVKGVVAVVVNGCQSGCFADAARADPDFKGVVIAACSVGYATTQCEHTGTSAVYAGFLGLYRDDPSAVKNLATSSISSGFWFENIRRKLSDIGAGGLPISYDPVVYSTCNFLF